MNEKTITPIAYIKTDFKEKFGIPRQSGRAPSAMGEIVFLDKFNDEKAIKRIEEFSHLWLIFGFSKNPETDSLSVRPPRLGGNEKVGVFASRSPFRPNGLGLSCVKLERVEATKNGTILVVSGADLKNDTPIFDIKPYLPYVDNIPDAVGGFSDEHKEDYLCVEFIDSIEIDHDLKTEIIEILSLDPRPQYQDSEDRVYGISYKNIEIKFVYKDSKILVTDIEVVK
jgi:tRNA-Thr(GGU) m(6)t(6)A37 methyltransferase TsaA